MPDRVTQAVKEAQTVLARYVEPGPRDCEKTLDELLSVLDHETVVAAIAEMEARGKAVGELRSTLDRGELPQATPPKNNAEPDLPLMPPERRPQDPGMDGSDLRFEGYWVETREHAGEYPDTMPQAIQVTDAEGRKATYVPLSNDGKVVDSSAVVQKLKECEDR